MSTRPPVHPSTRLIIDTDPGIDDVVTLALAARSPEFDIVAVTTTYGNATLDVTTRNAHQVLRLAGRSDIPVHPGAERPLTRELVTAPETHGESGVGYAAVRSETRDKGRETGASFAGTTRPASPVTRPALVAALESSDSPITLVTLGPLTNLALALEYDPDLVRSRITRHLGMFGSIHAVGNTNRFADFNAWCDPEAADRVLRSGLPTEMVGLDVTRRMVFDPAEVERFATAKDPLVSWLGLALRFYVEFHREAERLEGCVVNDVLTIGELLAPGLLRFEKMKLHVDLDAGDHRGHTRQSSEGIPVRVAMDVNVKEMRALLRRIFGGAMESEPPPIIYRQPPAP